MKFDSSIYELASKVKMLAVDCDGVLTDGRLYFNDQGEALKAFHVHDGQGLVSLQAAGFITAIVTARSSGILTARAGELGIRHLVQDAKDKAHEISRICDQEGIDLKEVAYVGDDIADIGVMKLVGLPVSVANGVLVARDAALFVTSKNGGCGAVREVADMLLMARS